MARKTLAEQLAGKAQQLRTTQAAKSASSAALIVASEDAARESVIASTQAGAVEEAARILDAAGVTL